MGKILGRMILFAAATIVAAQFMVAQVRIRDPKQAIDEEYTKKIREYTTEPFFNSPWTDYLPASATVPTPKAVLGDVAGAPNKLPYSTDVYRYMRMLERATGRVKVVSIGTTEEGREMIAVAVASEKLIADLEQNRSRLARLSDPRLIKMDDAEAERLVAASVPIYYITGSIHAPETGPSADIAVPGRIEPTTTIGLSVWTTRLRKNEVSSSVSVPWVMTTPSTAATGRSMFTTGISRIPDRTGRTSFIGANTWRMTTIGTRWPLH